MKFQYYLKEPLFRVGDIDVQSVSRPKNYKHSFKNGREKHGFICVTCGQIAYSFEGKEEIDLIVKYIKEA